MIQVAVGQRFDFLTVRGEAARVPGRDHRWVQVVCDCGVEKTVRVDHLDRIRSCGCQRKALAAQMNRTHGMSRSPEYQAWGCMRLRCSDPQDSQYENYGARGIRVCDEWEASFEAFFADLGARSSPKHSLDRIDNDKNYEPGNCKWSTDKEQVRNRRISLRVDFDGRNALLIEFAEERGLDYHVVWQRIYRYGWTVHRALTSPLGAPRWAKGRAA